ncbi:unnamed protein product [Clavelina lepadiformis]|uniref:3-beta hydroxysteroid dehydrogenase/isomerase domain-containing protein n=1 Tax=Clavelina lepadiformis TaxID=159417 RepID=A0ABP0G5D5_CLALP
MQAKSELVGGKGYFLGDDSPQLSHPRFTFQFFEPFGYKLHGREPTAPFWLLYLVLSLQFYLALFLRLLGVKMQIPLSPANLKNVCTTFTFSHKKFTNDFDYKPLRSWEESLEMIREETKEFLELIKGARR